MAATVDTRINTGATPTVATAEGGGVGWGLADAKDASATPVTVPTATGTTFTYAKTFHLEVTAGGGTTSISQRKIRFATAPATGLLGWWKAAATYTQATGAAAVDSGSNGATPSGYTSLTTSFQTWDATSAAATNSTKNGQYVVVALGVDNTYAGGASASAAVPNIELQYLET